MKKPPQKARVVALRGDHTEDLITQESLRQLENLQRMQWTVDKKAALLSEEIQTRLKHGASVEDGPLYFDRELEMVRSQKKAGAG